MKMCVMLLSCLCVMGCGKQSSPGPERPEVVYSMPQAQEASTEPERSGETMSVDSAYAKGVVIRKSKEKIAGHILLQCPGYLTVCFKINSSEPGSSEPVPIREVQSVVLESDRADVDPVWEEFQEKFTVVFGHAKEATTEDVIGTVTLDGQPVGNAKVAFVPVDGGKPLAGRTNVHGAFKLGKGATPGKYEVRIDRTESPLTGGESEKTTGDVGSEKSGGGNAEVGSGR